MIEILPESQGNLIAVKASGKVTDQDYKEILIPKADRVLAENDRANFLFWLSDQFEGFELGAAWDDIKYASGHHDKFDKVALVGGPRWVEWTSKIFGPMLKAEVKHFEEVQIVEAWSWIQS